MDRLPIGRDQFVDDHCRLLLLTVLLLEITALSRDGTKFTAQIGAVIIPTERSPGAANALSSEES